MTLPDKEEISENIYNMPVDKAKKTLESTTLGSTLAKVLVRAKHDDRITSGIFECASYLETYPDMVMVCLLPEATPDDIAMSIPHKLIDAYCLENDIPVAKINNCEKFSTLLGNASPQQKTTNDNPVTCPSLDCSCVLIGWPPKDKTNKHETRLMEKIWPNQIIELPI